LLSNRLLERFPASQINGASGGIPSRETFVQRRFYYVWPLSPGGACIETICMSRCCDLCA
jgi:hypothetical protein